MNLLCGMRAQEKLRTDKMTPEAKRLVHDRLMDIAVDWVGTDPSADKLAFKNVRDGNYNNANTFGWLFNKYTGKDISYSDKPIYLSDVRKFEIGLRRYNALVSKKDGAIWSQFHLPRAAMKNVPELARFEQEIVFESGFFRNYTNETSKQVNEILMDVKDLGLGMGATISERSSLFSAGARTLKKLNAEYSFLVAKIKDTPNRNFSEKRRLTERLNKNRADIKKFHEKGQGQAYVLLTHVLQGAEIETLKWTDHRGTLKPLDNAQKARLYNVRKNYNLIRAAGVSGLIRGLQKLKQLAESKNLHWADKAIERANGLIRAIEFQKRIDSDGKTINYRDMVGDSQFKELGFKPDLTSENRSAPDRKVAFSKHYMTKYTLGVLKTIKRMEKQIEEGELSIDRQIERELAEFESIVNVAKPENPVVDRQWDNDPYFFLRQYTSDVGIFNYKMHVKDTFNKGSQAIIKEHLNPSKESGRQDLVESSTAMLDLMRDVYNEIQMKDPTESSLVNDVQALMTSFTYFRLMGGNVRSATRNATQRLYEFVEYGLKATMFDAPRFYKSSGGSKDNIAKVTEQLRKFGLQWYDGKSKASNAWDAFTKHDMQVSEQSRGALDDAYMNDRTLFIDQNGELQTRGGGKRFLEGPAQAMGTIAKKAGFMHKLVEDWNRAGTFRTAFALASQNLQSGNRDWLARKIMSKSEVDLIRRNLGDDKYQVTYKDFQEKHGVKSEKILENWIDNTAGQMAYNSVLDLHFEYSKWAKVKGIRASKQDYWLTQLAKTGIGQFSHYRFNMFNLMYRWIDEAGISLRAGDFTSQEIWRGLRFGILQATIMGTTIATRTNFMKLMPNDVIETGEAAWHWQTVQREKFMNGTASKESLEALDQATYGQGGQYFLGPNFQYLASAIELMGLYEVSKKNPVSQLAETGPGFSSEWGANIYERSAQKAFKDTKLKENYDWWANWNSQFARTWNYGAQMFTEGGGLKDWAALEFGLFPSKTQRKYSNEFYEWLGMKKKKSRKKVFKKSMSRRDREATLRALARF